MTDALQEAAELTARALGELRKENVQIRDDLHNIRVHAEGLLTELDNLRQGSIRALAERDYYMRECQRLDAKFTMFASMAMEALQEHRQAPFRPNGAPPPDEPAKDNGGTTAIAEANGLDDAIPEFLTKPMAEPADKVVPIIPGPLKLKRRLSP